MNAPQKIVRQLFRRRCLERRHSASLRVHRAEDVSDRAVLAGGVHPLEADEERTRVLGVEHRLQIVKASLVDLEVRGRFSLVFMAGLQP
jgi:hypothetical protein